MKVTESKIETMSEAKIGVSHTVSEIGVTEVAVSETEVAMRLCGWPSTVRLSCGPWLSNGLVDWCGVVELGKGKREKDELLLSLEEEGSQRQLLQLVELPAGNPHGIALGSEREEHQGHGGDEEQQCGGTHIEA